MAYPKKWIGQMVTRGSTRLLTDDSPSNSKLYVFSDSVLCIGGKCPDHSEAARIWETDRIKYFVASLEYRQLYDLASEPVKFEWKIYVARTSIQILEYIREMLAEGVRHQLVAKQERIFLPSKRNTCCFGRQILRCRTMVIARTWKRRKVVRKLDRKTIGEMELCSGDCDARIRQDRAPCVQVLVSSKRRAQN